MAMTTNKIHTAKQRTVSQFSFKYLNISRSFLIRERFTRPIPLNKVFAFGQSVRQASRYYARPYTARKRAGRKNTTEVLPRFVRQRVFRLFLCRHSGRSINPNRTKTMPYVLSTKRAENAQNCKTGQMMFGRNFSIRFCAVLLLKEGSFGEKTELGTHGLLLQCSPCRWEQKPAT